MGIATAEQLKYTVEQATKDLPLLGYITMWNLRGVEIEQSQLTAALKLFNFEKHKVRPIGKHTALRRALMKWARSKQSGSDGEDGDDWMDSTEPETSGQAANAGERKKALVRKIKTKDDNLIVMAVVIENIDSDLLQLGYGTEIRVSYNKKKNVLSISDVSAGDIEEDDDDDSGAAEMQEEYSKAMIRSEVRQLFDHYQKTYLSVDLGDLIKDIIQDAKGFKVRQLGGIYFVPGSDKAVYTTLENLRKLVMENFGARNHSEMTILPQPDVDSSRKQLANAAFNSTIAEIKEMEDELETLRLNAETGDHKVRSWNIERKLTTYKKLLDKARTYKEVLGMQQDRITELASQMQQKAALVLEKITDLEEEANEEDKFAREAVEVIEQPVKKKGEKKKIKFVPEPEIELDFEELFKD